MKKAEIDALILSLGNRFAKNTQRHQAIDWEKVKARLLTDPKKLNVLQEMENTGGEPDVIGEDKKTGEFIFCDCSAESPTDRRSLCYDRKALDARKENKPKGNAMEMAAAMGIELLTEEEYRALQTLGEFDKKSSSWIKTPKDIRELGGALFCDRRYGHVFMYHNGADSYYAVRGFRGRILI